MNLFNCWPRFLKHQLRLYSNTWKPKNHYESLGISSKCTQGEVKSAYYQLSMLYHPDKNQGNPDSLQKFRDINEAYEVLGNINSRRLYDRGMFVGNSRQVYDERSENKFYKPRQPSRPPTFARRTPIYDFDEWSKMHYGTTFRQQQENKRRSKSYQESQQQQKDSAKMENFLLVFGFIAILCMLIVSEKDYDFTFNRRNNNSSHSGVNEQ